MHYSEFENIPHDQHHDFLRRISEEDYRDLVDQRPYRMTPHKNQPSRSYFDDAEAFYQHILTHWAPASKPWRADTAIEHELSHARYALSIGAIAVKYSINQNLPTEPLHTHITYKPDALLPNLAVSAISANPWDSWSRSSIDREEMRRYGYPSRSYISERIHRWNEQHFGPTLPDLETQEEAMERIYMREQERLNP